MEKYQTLGRRFGALMVDSIIIMLINEIISLFFRALTPTPTTNALLPALVGISSVFYLIVTHYRYGQTVGKKAVQIKLGDDSESPINFGQSVLRSLPLLIPAMFAVSFSTADKSEGTAAAILEKIIYVLVAVFFIADIVVCLINEKHRALHDFIAGTIVVRTDV